MSNQSQYVFETMLRIINKTSELMIKPQKYGTDDVLYASEIHMIDVIGRYPGIYVTEIANKLGITKGAVPKMIRKLLQKEMIYRYQENDNKKMVHFELTEKGRMAFQMHTEFHQKMDQDIIKKYNSLQEPELLIFKDIMSDIEQYIDKMRQR
jgi:DNA-binding MarR family transcriptional regulator